MADKRPWAKIDTGYILNPKWFQVERSVRAQMAKPMANAMAKPMANDMALAIANALRCAREAHLASILYCAQNMTDGVFPVRTIKALSMVSTPEEEAAITALFEVGLWINHPGGMAEVRDFLEHQTPATLSKARSTAGKKGAASRWNDDGKANGKTRKVANGKTMASANAEEKRREEKIINSDFDAWYASYPRKAKRADALSAFKAARKKICQEDLVDATKAYAKSVEGKDKQYVRYPATWLRAESWLDEVEAPASTPVYDPWEANRI